MQMPTASQRAKYIEIFILTLATIFASIELGLCIHERININDLAGSSATERLDYIIFCSGWTIIFCIVWILAALMVNSGILASPTPHIVYFVFTAVLWLAAGFLWRDETKDNGCDFGHDMCGTNKTIQGITWMQALKHVIGTITTLRKMQSDTKAKSDAIKMTGDYSDDTRYDTVYLTDRV
ncbi:hypothetical protein FRB98_000799 [Tulasnella sp. 332]|nr:hypothetical protein FRB98_000799 [Tulasnella sp. 332]